MKLILFIICFTAAQASAVVYGQTISLKIEKENLEEALIKISKQSKYDLVYDSKLLKNIKSRDVDLKNISVEEALDELFRGQPLKYTLSKNTIVVRARPIVKQTIEPVEGVIQQKEIRGRVTDEEGEPLIGVNVQVKGKPTGTTTNVEGRFSLNLEGGETLVFTYVGFSPQEVIYTNQSALNIILKPSELTIEEVVIVGYGAQRKSLVTSSVSTVKQESIRETPGASLQNMLTGKVTGLVTQQRSGRPGGDGADFNIRGVATYNGGTSPLILVDDIEYNAGQFAMIDVNEVESISILKDAEATAVYGVKGANGVVLVTTRRGRSGKPVISLRSQIGAQIPVKTMETLRSYDAALLTNEALINDGLNPLFNDRDIELFRTGEDPYGHPDVDWYKEVYKNYAPTSEHTLDISGGTERVKYFVSMGYLNQGGLLRDIEYKGKEPEPNTSDINNNYYFNRYKFRSNLDFQATNSLTLKLDLTGTYAETNQPTPNAAFEIFQYDYVRPYGYPVYNPDGSFGYSNPSIYEPRDKFNNVAALMALGGYSRNYNNFMNASLSATQKLDRFVEGLSLKGMVTYSYANTATRSMSRSGIPAYYYNPEDGSYTPRDINLYRVSPYSLGYGGGTPNNRLNIQAHLNYSRTFGNDHNVSALLLFNQTSYTDGAALPFNFQGYTYRFGYNFKERYIFSASGAYNGSDRFISQKRFNLFPAFALAWNIDKEDFFESLKPTFSAFKIRGSYGIVGNDNIGSSNIYFYEETYNRNGNYPFGESPTSIGAIFEGSRGNDDVSWETERKTNIGVDMGFLNSKITISADYFYNHRFDILTRRQTIPRSFGIETGTLPLINLGEVSNSGLELELAYKDKIGELGYNLRGQLSIAKNKLIFRDDPPALYPWQDRTGMALGTNRQYIWEGGFYSAEDLTNTAVAKPSGTVRQGFLKYKDLNDDGLINVDDMAYTGRPSMPTTVIGLTLGVNYKGFSISALLQSNLGGDAHVGFDMAVPFKAALQPIHQGRWTPETASTATFPALTNNFVGTYMNPNGNLSSFWTMNTDYLRLRSLELGYTFSEDITSKLNLKGLRVFANGYNLITWSKFFNKYQYDPEVAANINTYVYPVTRIINVGVGINL